MVLIFSTPCSAARLSNAENLTEKVNDTAGRQFRAQRRETDEIAEQNGRFSDAIGDDFARSPRSGIESLAPLI
jgi:hypothetical protein